MRRTRPAFSLTLAILALVAALGATPDTAAAGTKTFKPASARGKVVAFRLRHLKPASIRSARLHTRGHRRSRRLSVRGVRRAARHGVLRVHVRRLRRGTRAKLRLVIHTTHPKGTPALAGAPSTRHVTPGVVSAITWGQSGAQVDTELSRLKDAGVPWLEVTVGWEYYEPDAKGTFNEGALAYWDQAIAKAQAAGFRLMVRIVPSVPYWASADPSKHVDSAGGHVWDPHWKPNDWNDFADFARRMAAHYGERGIHAFEVWNEPDLKLNWPSGPNPAEFAQLLKTVYPAMKAGDPGSTVISGGLASNNYPFLEGMYAAGARGSFDALGVHPYIHCQTAPTTSWLDANGRVSMGTMPGLQEVHRSMEASGDGGTGIWITEFGWGTGGGSCGVSEETQAAWLTSAYDYLNQLPYVRAAFWYMSRENPFNPDDSAPEAKFGLMSSRMDRMKPAYYAMKAYANSLN